jgi:hypothetical protein
LVVYKTMQKLPKYMHKPRKFRKNQCVQGKPSESEPSMVFEISDENGRKIAVDAGKLSDKKFLSDEMNQKLQDFIFGSSNTPQKSVAMEMKVVR